MKPNKNYKTYVVTVEIRSGDHEKHNSKLVHAPDSETAWHYACYAESHNPDELQWNRDSWDKHQWCNEPDWSFAYRVGGVEEVPADEVPVLRKHLSYMVYDEADLAKSGDYLEEMIQSDHNNEVQRTAKTVIIRLSEPRTLNILIDSFQDSGYMNIHGTDIIIDTAHVDEDPSTLLEITGLDPAILDVHDYLVFYV